jgi:DNA replication protein DnaC
MPTLFITVPDLLDALRFTYNNQESTFEQRFEEIRTAPLLIMDDFGTQNATPWAQEKLFQILNYRYINRLPLVVTTNLLLDQIEGRIRSRLEDPELVTRVFIQAPDYRRPTDDSTHSDISLSMHHEQTLAPGMTVRRRTFQRTKTWKDKKLPHYARSPKGLRFTGTFGSGKTWLHQSQISDIGQPHD